MENEKTQKRTPEVRPTGDLTHWNHGSQRSRITRDMKIISHPTVRCGETSRGLDRQTERSSDRGASTASEKCDTGFDSELDKDLNDGEKTGEGR